MAGKFESSNVPGWTGQSGDLWPMRRGGYMLCSMLACYVMPAIVQGTNACPQQRRVEHS